jgi:hypothetical protein
VFLFVIAIIAALVAVGGLAALFLGTSQDTRGGGVLTFLGAGLVSLALLLTSSVSTVPTRNVGIVTEFNKPTGRTTGAGLKWHAPWQGIDDWDASRNTFDRLGKNCLWVSVSGGRACIAVQIEWSAKAENAPQDWAAYKAVDGIDGGRFGTFVARRVNPQMDAAITTAFTAFNPLGQVDEKTGALKAPDLNKEYRDALMGTLAANLGTSITVDSIAFGTPTYDEPTTAAISAFGQKTLESRNLAVDEANAKTRARITATDASVDQVARCLQIAEKLGKEPGLCMNPLGALANPAK